MARQTKKTPTPTPSLEEKIVKTKKQLIDLRALNWRSVKYWRESLKYDKWRTSKWIELRIKQSRIAKNHKLKK